MPDLDSVRIRHLSVLVDQLAGAPPECRDQGYRDVVRALVGCSSLAVVLAVATVGCSGPPTSAPPARSTAPAVFPSTTGLSTTTTTLLSIEPCGGIASSSDLHPDVDNRSLLLTQDGSPQGYEFGVPQVAKGPTIIASVPSSSPAVYESLVVPASLGGWGGQEVIGEVESSEVASQLAHQVESDLVSCYGGPQVALPTSRPGVTAETYAFGLSRSNGSIRNATVTVAQGRFIVSLQWHASNTCSTYGGGACPPPAASAPAMPSALNMAEVVDAALTRIRGEQPRLGQVRNSTQRP